MAVNREDSSVKVAVRVRPLNSNEVSSGCEEIAHITPGAPQVSIGENKSYTFDYVFGPSTKQHIIYDQCVEALVQAFFEGFNATILAYGQTGSGKTFTMGTSSNMGVEEEMQGIVPRVIVQIFDFLEEKRKAEPHTRYLLSLQFLEIYGESIKDLLDPSSEGVRIHEDFNGGISVHNAKEEVVNSVEELMLALEKGSVGRTTGSTLMNAHSSRSHAIFTLVLEQRISNGTSSNSAPLSPNPKFEEEEEVGGLEDRAPEDPSESVLDTTMDQDVETRKSKFHFVDLAGSERLKKTGATGQRMKEGIDINKGLLVLGNVISALGDDKLRGKVHVPYRDSKLTRMLQDSLGGNSKTLFICCCSPADSNANETEASLSYANRARNIKNKPVVNRDATSALIAEMKQQLQVLATELLRAKTEFSADIRTPRELLQEFAITSISQPKDSQRPMTASSQELGTLHSRVSEADAEIQRLTEELKKMKALVGRRDEQLTAMRAERDFLYLQCQEHSIDLPVGESTPPDEAGSEAASSTPAGGETTEEKKSEPKLAGGHSLQLIKGYVEEIASLKAKLEESEQKQEEMELKMMEQHRSFMSRVQSQFDSFMETGELGDLMDETEHVADIVMKAKKKIKKEAEKLETLRKTSVQGEHSPKSQDHQGRNEPTEPKKAWVSETEEEEQALEESEQKSLEESVEREAMLLKQEGELKTEQRSFNHLQAQANADITELTESIRLKEELLKQLVKSEEKYEMMKNFYEQKLQDMDNKIKNGESERENLVREIGTMEAKTPRHRDSAGVARLKSKLKEKDQELQDLRKKQSQLSRLAKQKNRNDTELRRLENEIVSMKRARVDLIRKNESDRKRHMQELKKRKKEIEMLRRYQKQDQNRLKKAQGEKMKSEKMLKRRMEELATLKQKHNELFDRRNNSKRSLNERAARKWLDQKVAEVSKREDELQRLKSEYRRRMMLQRQKQSLEVVRQSMKDRCTLRDVISQEATILLGASTQTQDNKPSSLTSEEEEALKDIENQISELTTQLQHKDRKISDLRTRYSGEGGALSREETHKQQLSQLTKNLNTVPQAQSVIRLLFKMLVSTRKRHKQSSSQVENLQTKVKQLTASVTEGERKFTMEVRRFDQEITKAATEYEKKLSGLIDHTQMSGFFKGKDGESFGSNGFVSPTNKGMECSDEAMPLANPPLTPGGSWSFTGEGDPNQFRVMLRLANERNESLRRQLSRLQNGKEEMTRWLMDLETARAKDKEAADDNEQMVQWLEYDLKTLRLKYSKMKDKLAKAEHKIKELSGFDGRPEDEEIDDIIVSSDADQVVSDDDSDSSSVDIPWEDILAIEQGGGKVPDFFQDGKVDQRASGGHKSAPKNIFERLTNPNNFTGMHKVNEQEIEHKRQLVQKLRNEEKSRKIRNSREINIDDLESVASADAENTPHFHPSQSHSPKNDRLSRVASERMGGNIFDRLTNPEYFTGTQKKKIYDKSESFEEPFDRSRIGSCTSIGSEENITAENLMRSINETEERREKLKARRSFKNEKPPNPKIFDRLAAQATVAASSRIQETKPKVQKPSADTEAPPPFKPSGPMNLKRHGSHDDLYYSALVRKQLGQAISPRASPRLSSVSPEATDSPRSVKTPDAEEVEDDDVKDNRVRFRMPRR